MEEWQKQRAELRATRMALAVGIAKALGAEVIEPKDESDISEHRSLTLTLDGRGIHLSFWQGKITVSGSWPKERQQDGSVNYVSPRDVGALKYDEAEQDIRVSESRGAEVIAKDIKRRFLPEFIRLYDLTVEFIKKREKAGRTALAAARELADACGIKRDIKADGQNAQIWHPDVGPVRISAHSDGVSVRIERNLDGLTLKQAKQILALLSKQ